MDKQKILNVIVVIVLLILAFTSGFLYGFKRVNQAYIQDAENQCIEYINENYNTNTGSSFNYDSSALDERINKDMSRS